MLECAEVEVLFLGETNMDFLNEHKKNVEKLCAELKPLEKRKVALMCLERQFKAYQQLAENKEWDRRKEYRKLLDECWNAVLDSTELGEEIWEKHEKIRPENVNSRKEEYTQIEFAYGNIFASNMESYLEMLLDNTGGEESFFLLNIDFILSYVNEEGIVQDEEMKKCFILREVKNQADDVVEQRNLIKFKDALSWYKQTDNLIKNISLPSR